MINFNPIINQLQKRSLKYLFWGGSHNPGSDIDLYAIFENEPIYQYWPSRIDLCEYLERFTRKKTALLDPEFVEIFFSELVFGNYQEIESIRRVIKETPISHQIISYLDREGKIGLKAQPNNPNNDPLIELINLINKSYVVSCSLLTDLYKSKKSPGPIFFKDLIRRPTAKKLRLIRSRIKHLKKGVIRMTGRVIVPMGPTPYGGDIHQTLIIDRDGTIIDDHVTARIPGGQKINVRP